MGLWPLFPPTCALFVGPPLNVHALAPHPYFYFSKFKTFLVARVSSAFSTFSGLTAKLSHPLRWLVAWLLDYPSLPTSSHPTCFSTTLSTSLLLLAPPLPAMASSVTVGCATVRPPSLLNGWRTSFLGFVLSCPPL